MRILNRAFLFTALTALSLSALSACAPAAQTMNGQLAEKSSSDDPIPEGAEEVVPASPETLEKLTRFTNPEIDDTAAAFALSKYAGVDPGGVIPSTLLSKALAYYDANKSHLDNTSYLTIIDFAAKSTRSRMFVVDMSSGAVWSMHVAHGTGSDKNNDGYAERFSNTEGSNASSLGFYRTAETYSGKNGYSLRIDGLSSSNSNARSRAVVVHGADYVSESGSKPGRSWGCPAVKMSYRTKLINQIKNGSLIYAGLSS